MNSVKKLISSLVFCLILTVANAQISFGGHAGINHAGIKTGYKEYQYSKTSVKRTPVLVLGLFSEIPLSNRATFRPEINFIQKGVEMSFMNFEFSAMQVKSREHRLNFVEIPLNFVYKLPWADGRYSIGGGPSVAFGIGGRHSYEHNTPALSGTGRINFDGKEQEAGENDIHLKPLEIGFTVGAIMTLSRGFFISAGFNAGVNSLDVKSQWNSYKTNGIVLKLGYMISPAQSKKSN